MDKQNYFCNRPQLRQNFFKPSKRKNCLSFLQGVVERSEKNVNYLDLKNIKIGIISLINSIHYTWAKQTRKSTTIAVIIAFLRPYLR